ncbi:hypothetical protein [Mesorhizobium sp. M0500]|uniref:Dyp-type peroxidase n=1 Tax=Mesorhizobium sp. M0500 TaxID=2956953 RepID=UPI003336C6FC
MYRISWSRSRHHQSAPVFACGARSFRPAFGAWCCAAWNALSIEEPEGIVGRKKLSDVELDDAVKPISAHNALTTIIEDGEQLQIVHDSMPFGDVGKGEFGTYFIGYARSLRRIEQMLENMIVGRPPGNYDRLLDFSRAITGTLRAVGGIPRKSCDEGRPPRLLVLPCRADLIRQSLSAVEPKCDRGPNRCS